MLSRVSPSTSEGSSDIDFLVTLASEATLFDQGLAAGDLSDLMGFRVDVISDGAPTLPRHRRILQDAVPLTVGSALPDDMPGARSATPITMNRAG